MKWWAFLFLLIMIACNSQPQKTESSTVAVAETTSSITTANTGGGKEICWFGTLNGKTPVFIHYSKLDSNLLAGEITYLNTKDKLPITLLGTIEEDKSFRLLEFEPSGNITGIITGTPSENTFTGSWFSPKTRKELVLSMQKKDSMVNPVSTAASLADVFGTYRYQYSEAGYQGAIDITRLPDSRASFAINAVTGEPARNIAEIPEDTIKLSTTHFIYKLPDTDDCEFEVRFYKGFACIRYTKGSCEGEFGHNATIDGIFLKTK